MGSIGVSELSDALDIPVSTAYAHLDTLRQLGYVVKKDSQYSIGHRFLRHAGAIRQNIEINRLARKEVHQLAQATGEVAGFGVEEEGQRVIIHRCTNEIGIDDNNPIGEYIPLHWSSIGKAIFAHLPEERQHEIIDRHGLPGSTQNTITDFDRLFDELEAIRAQGYAIDDGERCEDIRGVAVPIQDHDDNVLGAIGVARPKFLFTVNQMGKLAQLLRLRKNILELKHNYQD